MKVLKIKFGATGNKDDAYGIRFYGDFDGDGEKLGRISETFSDPDVPAMIGNKRISLWFTFEKVRSYERVSHFLDDLVNRLKEEGYEVVFSSIDDLVDTTLSEYTGKPESKFPPSQRIHDYNASGGFTVTSEKKDVGAKFSGKEIEAIQALAQKFGLIVYNKNLLEAHNRTEKIRTKEKAGARETHITTSIEQEELRGISRSVAEIQWLLISLVILYHALGGTDVKDEPSMILSLVLYALFIMGFRYARFFKQESRWKLAVETWVMIGFITWVTWHTGRLESPLLNCYLLVIITSALTLGKLTTLLELALIAACFVFLGSHGSIQEFVSLKHSGGAFALFGPFVLVAYISTMFASDIRYGLNKVKLLSETDELTNVLNRRGLASIAGRLIGQSVRYGRPLSLLAIDSDNLKGINDDYGHKAGDQLLIALAKTIQSELRSTDILARQGGDEFAVLLPETPSDGAHDFAERIRNAVENMPLVADGKLIRTTVSIGVASCPSEGRSLDALLAQADYRMYEAKSGGRNRIV